MLKYFGGKIVREAILNFLTRMLPGETLCKKFPIFPPKDLVQFLRRFTGHLFIEFKLIN